MFSNRYNRLGTRPLGFQPLETRQMMAADTGETALQQTEVARVTDRPEVRASFGSEVVREGNALDLVLSRTSSDISRPLVVRVAGGDAEQLAIPSTITIPARQRQIVLRVNALDDDVAETVQRMEYTFTATGHRSATARVELIDDERPKFQNPGMAVDVNNDGVATALDALLIINRLSRQSDQNLSPSTTDPQGHFHDVNGDYRATALDALQVINAISRGEEATASARANLSAIDDFHTQLGEIHL